MEEVYPRGHHLPILVQQLRTIHSREAMLVEWSVVIFSETIYSNARCTSTCAVVHYPLQSKVVLADVQLYFTGSLRNLYLYISLLGL